MFQNMRGVSEKPPLAPELSFNFILHFDLVAFCGRLFMPPRLSAVYNVEVERSSVL